LELTLDYFGDLVQVFSADFVLCLV
jgi:hypothetical protein